MNDTASVLLDRFSCIKQPESGMKLRLPMVVLALFALTTTAIAQVEVSWDRTGEDIPSWFGTNTERGMAFGEVGGEARIYVTSYAGGEANVYIVDAETGDDLGTLDNTAIEGGFFGLILTDAAVSDDGVIFASNTASIGTNNLKIYRWSTEASDAEVVIDYDGVSGARMGDRISVAGSASDNSLVIYAAIARDNRVVRFTTNDNGFTFEAEVVTLEGVTDSGIQPSVHGFADGSFLFNAASFNDEAGVNPMHFEADGTLIAELSGDWLASNTIKAFTMGDRELMATFVGIHEGSQTVAFFDITDGLDNAEYLMSTPSLGMLANLFGAGDIGVAVDAEGQATIYVMAMNHGLRAFHAASIEATLEGTYYVGAEGTAPGGVDPDFSSLAEAFAAVNTQTATGGVTLLVTSDLDERGNTLAIESRTFTDTAPLTIKPAPGTAPTVYVSGGVAEELQAGAEGAGTGILIDNTSWVMVDGSNTHDGTTRDLTLVVDDEAAGVAVNVIRDAQHVTVKNVNVEVETGTAGVVGLRVRRDNASSVVPENVLFENNRVGSEEAAFFQAIAIFGTGGLVPQVDVIGNDIYASQRGITTFYVHNSQFSDNRIWITGQTPTTSWSGGIYLAVAEDINITRNEFLGFTTNNDAAQSNAAILLNANTGAVFITNNMVAISEFSNRGSYEDASFYAIGVNNAGGAGNHLIYHNTVRIGGSTENGRVAALGFDVPNTTQNFDLRNNIFVNEVDADNAMIIHWPIASTDLLNSDYNNLYVSGSNAAIASVDGELAANLGLWQFGHGHDANSVSKSVEFVSETDLRLTGSSVGDTDLAGTPIVFVQTDIDGTPRDEAFPYMGAFEGSIFINVEDAPVAELPEGFEVHQNYPNPFNPTTTISYTLSQAADVSVRVYNVAGQLVQELANGYQTQGRHEVRFDASGLASGVYLYRVQVGNQVQTRQMVLVK
jgi:hypothetical protein